MFPKYGNFLSNQNATNALGVVSKFTQPWKLKANPNSSLYIYTHTHIFPSFGGTLISERRGREEKEGAIWFGFRRRAWSFFFLRRWTQREGWSGVEGKKRWVWEPSLQMNIHVREVVSVSVRHWMKYCVQFYIAERP